LKFVLCDNCQGVMNYSSYFQYYYCSSCGNIVRPKLTNFEVVKNMTIEELAVLCGEMTVPQIRECMEKLAAYEDNDLSPDGVEELESKWLMQLIKEHKLHKRGGRNEKNNS